MTGFWLYVVSYISIIPYVPRAAVFTTSEFLMISRIIKSRAEYTRCPDRRSRSGKYVGAVVATTTRIGWQGRTNVEDMSHLQRYHKYSAKFTWPTYDKPLQNSVQPMEAAEPSYHFE